MFLPQRNRPPVLSNALLAWLMVCLGSSLIQAQSKVEQSLKEANQLRHEQLEESNRLAIDKYIEAGKLWEADKNAKQASIAFRNAAEILSLLGQSDEALRYYQKALVFAKRSGGLIEQAAIFNGLAYFHFISGNTKEAHKNCLAALSLGRRISSRAIEAEALSNLGEVFYNFGDLELARKTQEQSLAMWAELGNPRGQALALIALGYYYAALGQPEKALRSYRDGLSSAQKAKDLSVETLALLAIGNIRRKFGEKQEALAAYDAAKILAVRIGDQTAQAMAAGGTGYVALDLGDYNKALEYMEAAAALFERNGKLWGAAEVKLDQGKIHRSLGNGDKALKCLEQALALSKTLSMRRVEAATLGEMGAVYFRGGEYLKALRAYETALALFRQGSDKREEVYILNHMGMVYEGLKNADKALQYYRRALPLSRSVSDPEGESLTQYNLAHVERDKGNLIEARSHIEAALEIAERQRAKVVSQDLRTTYFATVRNAFELQIDILMRLHKQDPASGNNARAFAVSEKARARSFLELLREAQANVRGGADKELLSKERLIGEAINGKAQYQILLLGAEKKEEAAGVGKDIEALLTELQRVREAIRTASPHLAALSEPQLLSLNEVQQRVLDDETVLLEYVLGDDRSYVLVVTRTTFFSFDLASRVEIENGAKRLYDLITSFQMVFGESFATRSARQEKASLEFKSEVTILSRLVLQPLGDKLKKKKLLVVADGALQYVPFQLLINPETGNSLITTHEISYSPSASTLALLQEKASRRKPQVNSVAVLADPVFEADDPRVGLAANAADHTEVRQALRDVGISPDGVLIPRLIASGTEANAIMNVAPWRTSLKAVGFAANRERVLGPELANYRIVHFATHGIVNNEHPELSGIVLSLFDSEGRPQNGFLRLHDIYNLQLSADLVVLSACSTGLGKDVRGEGVIGLARGFMHAGASGVIASLWKVDDDATAELMKHFYAGLFKQNLSPAAALKAAQIAVSKNKRWESPYYWAGFVLQGQYTQSQKFTEPFPSRVHVALFASLSGVILVAGPILIARRRRRRDI